MPALEVCAGLLVAAMGARLVWTRRRPRGGDHRHHDHHLPPKDVRPSDLLAMGVSGGLVPCPEALGVMLIAIFSPGCSLGPDLPLTSLFRLLCPAG